MLPPEVILHRWVKARIQDSCEFKGYAGKLDIEQVGSSTLRTSLYGFQHAVNEALRLENANASGGTKHPPFHFDYLDASIEVKNAHAFQHEDFSFIVVTLPLIELTLEVSHRLSRSVVAAQLLHLELGDFDREIFQGFLAQIQLLFLIGHEYTHHVHQHIARTDLSGVWTEFPRPATPGNLDFQAEELDADEYATYLLLTHLLRGEGRHSAFIQSKTATISAEDGDKLILSSFFLAVLAFFCTFWRGEIGASLYELNHPPAPVRIQHVLRVAEMWCGQVGSISNRWFSSLQFQYLFGAAAGEIAMTVMQDWDAQIAILASPYGAEYDQLLLERFETLRRGMD
jgi:hypothetical protein